MEYGLDPNIIDNIFEIYKEDQTNLIMNGKEIGNVKIQSGIRQGCVASPTIFKIITNFIIKKLKEYNIGYRDWELLISCLFFADDGLMMANSIEDMKAILEFLKEITKEYGLEINMNKSEIIIYNMKAELKPTEITNIKVKDSIKYLGVEIIDKYNCFKKFKEEQINKARRLALQTKTITLQSCNKILIGKSYWKSLCLPGILYAAEVIEYSESEIKTLQTIENSVYRTILGARKFTPVETLRGEIGASLMRSRIDKNKLNFICSIKNLSDEDLVKKVMKWSLHTNIGKWSQNTKKILEKYELDLDSIDFKIIKDKIKEKDSLEWKNELENGSTLNII